MSSLHRSVALGATLLVVLHVTTMVVDPYAQIDLLDVVLPFRAGYAPLWVGLGTLALDLLVVVVVTGLLRHRLGRTSSASCTWRPTCCGRSRSSTHSAAGPTPATHG